MKAAVERAAAEYAAEAAKFQPSKEAGQEAGAESKKQKKKRNKHKKAAQDSSGPAAEQKVRYSHTHRRCSDAQTLLRHTQTHCSDTQTDTQALLRHTHTLLRQTSGEPVFPTVLVHSAMVTQHVNLVMHQTQLHTDKLCRCLKSSLSFILSCLFYETLLLLLFTPGVSLQQSYCH